MSKASPPRRVFLAWRELPGLITGVALGDARAMRRALGARRSGRYGAALFVLALALAATSAPAFVVGGGLHLALAFARATLGRGAEALGGVAQLRLATWACLVPLGFAALVRLAHADAYTASVAIVLGHGLCWVGQARGLDR